MTTRTSPLLPASEVRFFSSGEGGGGTATTESSGAAETVVCGCEVAVMPELKWEGDTSDCVML